MKTQNSITLRSAIAGLALMTAGVAGAQTNGSLLAAKAQPQPAAQEAAGRAVSATNKPPETTQGGVAARPRLGVTNAEPAQSGRLIQTQPENPFLETVPELAFSLPKANEMVVGNFTLSGISIQVLRARNPLQLVNPTAPSDYGSGVDNLDWFPASPNGPMLRLFSINF